MSTALPFGPQLIGETEKTLGAILRKVLGDRLTEAQWVSLRLALALEGSVRTSDELAAAIASRAHFADADDLVAGLNAEGLLERGAPTDAGRRLVGDIQQEIAKLTRPVWDGLPSEDVDAAGRLLNEVVVRARAALAS